MSWRLTAGEEYLVYRLLREGRVLDRRDKDRLADAYPNLTRERALAILSVHNLHGDRLLYGNWLSLDPASPLTDQLRVREALREDGLTDAELDKLEDIVVHRVTHIARDRGENHRLAERGLVWLHDDIVDSWWLRVEPTPAGESMRDALLVRRALLDGWPS